MLLCNSFSKPKLHFWVVWFWTCSQQSVLILVHHLVLTAYVCQVYSSHVTTNTGMCVNKWILLCQVCVCVCDVRNARKNRPNSAQVMLTWPQMQGTRYSVANPDLGQRVHTYIWRLLWCQISCKCLIFSHIPCHACSNHHQWPVLVCSPPWLPVSVSCVGRAEVLQMKMWG